MHRPKSIGSLLMHMPNTEIQTCLPPNGLAGPRRSGAPSPNFTHRATVPEKFVAQLLSIHSPASRVNDWIQGFEPHTVQRDPTRPLGKQNSFVLFALHEPFTGRCRRSCLRAPRRRTSWSTSSSRYFRPSDRSKR